MFIMSAKSVKDVLHYGCKDWAAWRCVIPYAFDTGLEVLGVGRESRKLDFNTSFLDERRLLTSVKSVLKEALVVLRGLKFS